MNTPVAVDAAADQTSDSTAAAESAAGASQISASQISAPQTSASQTAAAQAADAQSTPLPQPSGSPLAGVGYEKFRGIMGSFASGISVVTTLGSADEPFGMTCSAVCSVSADPPLLLSCVKTPSSTLDALGERGRFTVNFLDAQAREVSDLFASRTPDKFGAVGWRPGEVLGMPVLDRTLAHAECEVHRIIEAGDHVIVVGRIVGGCVDLDRYPLGYWRGSYVRLFRLSPSNGR